MTPSLSRRSTPRFAPRKFVPQLKVPGATVRMSPSSMMSLPCPYVASLQRTRIIERSLRVRMKKRYVKEIVSCSFSPRNLVEYFHHSIRTMIRGRRTPFKTFLLSLTPPFPVRTILAGSASRGSCVLSRLAFLASYPSFYVRVCACRASFTYGADPPQTTPSPAGQVRVGSCMQASKPAFVCVRM